MNMNGCMVVRIEHEPITEKDEYCWHNFFLLQRYAFLLNVARKCGDKFEFLRKKHLKIFEAKEEKRKRCILACPMYGARRIHLIIYYFKRNMTGISTEPATTLPSPLGTKRGINLTTLKASLSNRGSSLVFTAPEDETTVPAASKATVAVTVADAEGEPCTVSLEDADGIAAVESYENEDGIQDGITVADSVYSVEEGTSLKLNVVLAPAYGTAGKHTFKVTATDESDNVSSATVNYNVEHTNRPPEYVGATELAMKVGETSGQYHFAELFNDVDGDKMTYTTSVEADGNNKGDVTVNENGIVAYYSLNGTRLNGPRLGVCIVRYANGEVRKVIIR